MILVINSGSSSLKFKLYSSSQKELLGGLVERIGLGKPFLTYQLGGDHERTEKFTSVPDHAAALKHIFEIISSAGHDLKDVRFIGHRVVHGGEEFTESTVMTPARLKRLKKYTRLAPLHNPANIAGITSCMKLLPRARNVAVFDTAFHKTIPDHAFVYSLPWKYYKKHKIRKYGFHGISHSYVADQAARMLGKPIGRLNLITCHLGSGSSVTAIRKGKSVDTTMGFTPLEGLTMSTRCGDIDPAIPLYMIRTFHMTEQEVDFVLNSKSGLLGISGFKDLREVLAAAGQKIPGFRLKGRISRETRYRARLAIDIFSYDVARYIGQFASTMGGVDAIVFTAGIGERSAYIRDRIMKMVTLAGKPKVLVIPTNEELMIAREAKNVGK